MRPRFGGEMAFLWAKLGIVGAIIVCTAAMVGFYEETVASASTGERLVMGTIYMAVILTYIGVCETERRWYQIRLWEEFRHRKKAREKLAE